MNQQFSGTVRNFLAPILEHLDDPEVSEIMINSPQEVWVERRGRLEKTESRFESEESLMSAVNNIAQFVQRRIDQDTPFMDARLPDGSRVHAVRPPCARKGVWLAIRKFPHEELTIDKLVSLGALSQEAVPFLEACVLLKKNILVAGGAGSGKTSLLNAVSSLIPNHERIIIIEDAAELRLQQDHLLSLETKPADKKGKGEVSIRDLLRSSLRLRPDRIIIGEIRSGEALDFLQAMNTGHGGSMGSIHASSPLETLSRLETLTLFSDVELPINAIRQQISAAINILIQTSRFEDGSRKISHIAEVCPLEDDEYRVNTIFRFKQTGLDGLGKIEGQLQPTGQRPAFLDQILTAGLVLPSQLLNTWEK